MIKQATIPLYIRFGELPEKNISKVHFSDYVVREEGGLSVFKAIKANNRYYPVLPEDTNESGIADYFNLLLSDKNVYLVTGSEMRLEGADREPLLIPQTVVVIKELGKYYRRGE